jgi:aerobic C4-dicarboxylate transport protein
MVGDATSDVEPSAQLPPGPKRNTSRRLYLAVLGALIAGITLGVVAPQTAIACKPMGAGFVQLVKMLLGPIIFCTVVLGIGSIGNLRKVGRIGLKAIVYFETMTTVALLLGMGIAHAIKPGRGMHVQVASLPTTELQTILAHGGKHDGVVSHLLALIPESPTAAFAKGDALQILLLALLFGAALNALGTKVTRITQLLEQFLAVLFKMLSFIMLLAPVGAFGAIAFTVGQYGAASLLPLLKLMGAFYFTALFFVLIVLGAVCKFFKISLLKLLRYLKEELLLVIATSSSESALPALMTKLEALGCGASVVRLVIPTGYSFNLDGTCIYLTMAALFVAQALDVALSLREEVTLLGLLLLTSKGAAAVTGGGFVTLAATLGSTGTVPVAGLSLLLGIDRFMSEARAVTNLIGNSVATIVVAKWENDFDAQRAQQVLNSDVQAS